MGQGRCSVGTKSFPGKNKDGDGIKCPMLRKTKLLARPLPGRDRAWSITSNPVANRIPCATETS